MDFHVRKIKVFPKVAPEKISLDAEREDPAG
jgi:hypothetical protein